MKIGVLGAGSWGTALALVLARNDNKVHLWSYDPEEANKIRKSRRVMHKLPEIVLPDNIYITSEMDDFMEEAELLVSAVPSKAIREFGNRLASALKGKPKIIVSGSKGLDKNTLQSMCDILDEILPKEHVRGVVAISGPSHAEEVARQMPTTVVAAHQDESIAQEVQRLFQTPRFRVYTNKDRKGVETGAAFKNILAIAVGISDGLGFGDNARAGLISRGLHEMSFIGSALGAEPLTYAGLSGLGDLVVTCTSQHSRNRKFGELLAKGYSPADAEEEIGMVVEGLTTVEAVPEIKRRFDLEMPIAEQVYSIAIEGNDPKQAVENLMQRDLKPERSLES